MQVTPFLGLNIPEQSDIINIDILSGDLRILDNCIISDTIRRIELMTETAFSEITPAENTIYLVQDDTTGLLKSVYYGTVLLWERSE